LSCVSMTLSQSSDFSCNTPPLNDTVPALFTRMLRLPSSLSTLLSAGSNPARLVTSTLTAIAGTRLLSVQKALAGSFSLFRPNTATAAPASAIPAQCCDNSPYHQSREQPGRLVKQCRRFHQALPLRRRFHGKCTAMKSDLCKLSCTCSHLPHLIIATASERKYTSGHREKRWASH